MSTKTWLITGVSSGFGRLLAQAALERGDAVAGTLRQQEQISEFEALAPGRAHGILLDVTDRAAIGPAVATAIERLGGGLDILVNNAGFGMVGALEELDEDQIDDVFDTNLFGTIFVTRAALPALRASHGSLINISSAVGYYGMAASSTYCSAKFAVEGLTESLQGELAAFGVRVMLVEPGFFITNFAKTSLKIVRNPMAVYDDTPAGKVRQGKSDFPFTPNQPAKLVEIVMATLARDELPLRLVIGLDAMGMLQHKIASYQETLKAGEALAINRPG
jgi:NAD(P)-dependent dehydrogenase (short-subunit alcohol dehydrogenase family)